jgi:glyoxylase-like metal-dependent hydrolase (beta-lactamase superfamily II)
MPRPSNASRFLIALCFGIALAARAAHSAPATDAQRPELAYLKQVNLWRPPQDPQLLFLLMAQFANAERHEEGIEFFTAALERFDAQLDPPNRGLYLLAIASLRAGHAKDVSLLKRVGWVHDTVVMLDEAKRLLPSDVFVAHWMSGVVRSKLPAFFGERDNALQDLAWCEAHADKAPHPGWMREVYFALAVLTRARGDEARARQYDARSGLTGQTKQAIFTTPLALDPEAGHTFAARRIHEVVPGTVYALTGFEFTEYYFVVSADRRELIAIDAGTRPDSARAALEALYAAVPSLPPLTTVFVTHAHWDHVGGHSYFRRLGSAPRFINRVNYKDELERDATANPVGLRQFFGDRFHLADVLSYRADATIDKPTEMIVGGTRFELLPTRGGETDDAMLIQMPDQGVLFVGDILMPYVGAPFVEEGSVEGMLAAIEQVHALKPRVLLHGHEPLTRVFTSTAMLDDLHAHVGWLRAEVLDAIRGGTDRAAIHAANLIPPGLDRSGSDVQLAYLLLRENVINRLFDQNSGYWQNGLHGLDTLADADRGEVLVDYLGVSEVQISAAIEQMVADGKHELAAETLRWAQPRFPGSSRLQAERDLVYVKLMEKYQEFNPFKFIVYAGQIEASLARSDVPGDLPVSAAAR